MRKYFKHLSLVLVVMMVFTSQFVSVFAAATTTDGGIKNDIAADTAKDDKALPFTDTTNHWAKDSISYVYNQELFKGTSDTLFSPNKDMTRGMFVTILGRMSGIHVAGYGEMDMPFKDVTMDKYYGPYVAWALEKKIISSDNENFMANEVITREQMATMITNYCKHIKKGPVGAWAIKLNYTDLAEISKGAEEGIMFCTIKGYFKGYAEGSFGPQHGATRAEVATIIERIAKDIVQTGTEIPK